MNYVRRGNDITVEWTIYTQGQAQSLEGRDLHVYLTTVSGTVIREVPFVIGGDDDNILTLSCQGNEQDALGTYAFRVVENEGLENMKTLDSVAAFTLVSQTSNSDYNSLDEIVIRL